MAHHHHHNHDHEGQHHDHHHHHAVQLSKLSGAFIIGIVLNSVFVIIEATAGFATNSLALLTDAGHNLGDVAGLILALVAFRLAKVKGDKNFTYGYSKTTILVALANAVILLIAIGSIGYEAVQRLFKPQPTEGTVMAIVAGLGIIINTVSALFFLREKDSDLNARAAYLHLASDALVSLGVVITGGIIFYTHLYWLDSAVSLVIMLVILYGTWGLLKDSLRLSLDAVPRNIDVEKITTALMKMSGVTGVHHIHVWALSTQVNAMTAHLVIDDKLDSGQEQQLKDKVKHELLHMNIQHATLETEKSSSVCNEEKC